LCALRRSSGLPSLPPRENVFPPKRRARERRDRGFPHPMAGKQKRKNPCPPEPTNTGLAGLGRTGVSALGMSRYRCFLTPVPTRIPPLEHFFSRGESGLASMVVQTLRRKARSLRGLSEGVWEVR